MKTHWQASCPYPNEISPLRNELAIPAIGPVFQSSHFCFQGPLSMAGHQGEEGSNQQRLEREGEVGEVEGFDECRRGMERVPGCPPSCE